MYISSYFANSQTTERFHFFSPFPLLCTNAAATTAATTINHTSISAQPNAN